MPVWSRTVAERRSSFPRQRPSCWRWELRPGVGTAARGPAPAATEADDGDARHNDTRHDDDGRAGSCAAERDGRTRRHRGADGYADADVGPGR